MKSCGGLSLIGYLLLKHPLNHQKFNGRSTRIQLNLGWPLTGWKNPLPEGRHIDGHLDVAQWRPCEFDAFSGHSNSRKKWANKNLGRIGEIIIFFSDIKWYTFAQTICFAFSFKDHVHFCFFCFFRYRLLTQPSLFFFEAAYIFVPWSLKKWVFGIDGSIFWWFLDPGATWIHYVAAFYSFMPMTWGSKLWRSVISDPMTSLEGLLKVDFES